MKTNRCLIILAGTTLGSVLSLCKYGSLVGAKTFIICFNKEFCSHYRSSKYVSGAYYSDKDSLYSTCCNIIEIHQLDNKPLLYATTDEYCILINRYRELFSSAVELCIPSANIIERFCNKEYAAEAAASNGLSVPRSIVIRSLKELNTIESDFNFPVVIKPVSNELRDLVGYKFRIVDRAEFECEKSELTSLYNSVLCQEYIPGLDKDYMFYVFYRNEQGDIVECIGEKTLQINGIMAIGTTCSDKILKEISRTFLAKINYVGIGGIEYKKYKGKYYFIEMSTRTEGFLPISDMAGVSCAAASHNWNFFKNNTFKEKQQLNGIRYVVGVSTLLYFMKAKSFISIIKLLRNIIFAKHLYAVEIFIDSRPFLACITCSIRSRINRFFVVGKV